MKPFSALLIFLLIVAFPGGCKKLVDVSPPVTSTNGANVYTNDQTAIAALTSIYVTFSNSLLGGTIPATSFLCGLSADELDLYGGVTSPSLIGYYTNALTSLNTNGSDFWSGTYPIIYTTNAAISGLANSGNVTPAVARQLIGEARFVRAFCYFYLVNMYGDVPFVTGIDYTVNAQLARTPEAQVYAQVIADLQSAESLLSPSYVDASLLNASPERVRPIKWAADALLARVYLYDGQWANAEAMATTVINNNSLYSLTGLDSVFLRNSPEAIWQLQPTQVDVNSQEGRLFILPSSGPSEGFPTYLNTALLSSFEPGDNRYTNWIDSITVAIFGDTVTYYYPFKYKIPSRSTVSEYSTVLRLGEQFLIRAEARAQQGNTAGAAMDLNTIRTRAGLGNTTASAQAGLLAAIMHERQVELFTEWGHRWFDLKRTGQVDVVMSMVTPRKGGGAWNSYQQLFPVPQSELQLDTKLQQNPGYQ